MRAEVVMQNLYISNTSFPTISLYDHWRYCLIFKWISPAPPDIVQRSHSKGPIRPLYHYISHYPVQPTLSGCLVYAQGIWSHGKSKCVKESTSTNKHRPSLHWLHTSHDKRRIRDFNSRAIRQLHLKHECVMAESLRIKLSFFGYSEMFLMNMIIWICE